MIPLPEVVEDDPYEVDAASSRKLSPEQSEKRVHIVLELGLLRIL